MRRLIVWNMLTLDSFVGGTRGNDVDREAHLWGEELQRLSLEQSSSAGALLFGRDTYEMMSEYWSSAPGEVAAFISATPKIVFSRIVQDAGWSNTRFVTGSPELEVARMKRQRGRDLLVLGRGELSDLLVQHGLIDEWRLGVSPVVLGDGDPLESRPGHSRMTLLETRRFSSGCLILRYKRATKSELLYAARRERLTASNRRLTVVDGPFAESKEWALASDDDARPFQP